MSIDPINSMTIIISSRSIPPPLQTQRMLSFLLPKLNRRPSHRLRQPTTTICLPSPKSPLRLPPSLILGRERKDAPSTRIPRKKIRQPLPRLHRKPPQQNHISPLRRRESVLIRPKHLHADASRRRQTGVRNAEDGVIVSRPSFRADGISGAFCDDSEDIDGVRGGEGLLA